MKDIDIRLLEVFNAIHRTRSVTAAAEALGLGQPAVSVALAKLRRRFNDPLFVRTSSGMEPTPYGASLSQPVETVLDALAEVLSLRNEFDPATAERTFRVCMTDISQLVLLPLLWEKIRVVAPRIRVEVFPLTPDLPRMLERGGADLALGFIPQLDAGFYQQLLFMQSFVCIVGRAHPRITDSLSLAQFEHEGHAVITSSGAAPSLIDKAVLRQGIRRRVALDIPSFIGAAFVAEHTDLVVTIPTRLGTFLADHGRFRTFPVPFPLPPYGVKQHWHERFHHDKANIWLRRLVAELLADSTDSALPGPFAYSRT
ncbi:LysR family transcriptional regulator [Zoogloea sp.]|uniref:LysR family transcriptional regulator n=1 Tax=Zoogloea sp. TaxID=49181 RepID=UPI001415CEAA|nr:MAG: LysR family transcriptional regulator [Zoogloea sp.]